MTDKEKLARLEHALERYGLGLLIFYGILGIIGKAIQILQSFDGKYNITDMFLNQ
jgi:hypothetical protein